MQPFAKVIQVHSKWLQKLKSALVFKWYLLPLTSNSSLPLATYTISHPLLRPAFSKESLISVEYLGILRNQEQRKNNYNDVKNST